MMKVRQRYYPETSAGGFSRADGTIALFSRINALIEPDMTIVDFGAGRGRGAVDDPVAYRRGLRILKGKCRKVIGVDVDPVVKENPALDEAILIRADEPLPITDEAVDLIFSDMTFEHVTQPDSVAGELDRILKPGGWICARTPNRWGYIGMGTNLVPNRWHVAWLKWLQPHRKEVDVFPTAYRLNTRAALRRHFPTERYHHYTYGHFGEPGYFGRNRILWGLVLFLYRLMPEALAPMWLVLLQKKTEV